MTTTDPCLRPWTDQPCYSITVVDGSKQRLLAGPFPTRHEALEQVGRVRELVLECGDPDAWFHAYRVVTLKNGHPLGLLHRQLEQSPGRLPSL
jgi:hypothetical protein